MEMAVATVEVELAGLVAEWVAAARARRSRP
jgi:hypothetical protein